MAAARAVAGRACSAAGRRAVTHRMCPAWQRKRRSLRLRVAAVTIRDSFPNGKWLAAYRAYRAEVLSLFRMKDDTRNLSQVIETTMQIIIALRWAAQRGESLPESLDLASQDVLDLLYAWQRQGADNGRTADSDEARSHRNGAAVRVDAAGRALV